jgi:hypothetical protein
MKDMIMAEVEKRRKKGYKIWWINKAAKIILIAIKIELILVIV